MSQKISYAQFASAAMCRASKSAQQKAAELNLRIPIWKDGKVVYIDPKEILTKTCT